MQQRNCYVCAVSSGKNKESTRIFRIATQRSEKAALSWKMVNEQVRVVQLERDSRIREKELRIRKELHNL
jgi:hypothetical protein